MELLNSYRNKVKKQINSALSEDHTPRETAFSAALGTFVTVLPTLGIGILFFLVISRLFDSINKIALFACVVVFNPAMKYPIYILSYQIGSVLISSTPEKTVEVALTAQALDATKTMIIGNIFLAIVLSLTSYILVLKMSEKYEEKDLQIKEEIIEKV